MNLDLVQLVDVATRHADGHPPLEVAVELAATVRDLDQIVARIFGDDIFRFVATVRHVDVEASSTRGLVTVQAAGHEPEQLRTDRGDTPWGTIVTDRARRLAGQPCLIYKAVEEAGRDKKVRVLTWLQPLAGRDNPEFPEPPTRTPDTGPDPTTQGPAADLLRELVVKNVAVTDAELDAFASARFGRDRFYLLGPSAVARIRANLVKPGGMQRFVEACRDDHKAAHASESR